MAESRLAPMDEILADLRAGKMIILVDDDRRENEGDLVMATECVTPEAVAFMAQYARGLICVSLPVATAERLNLPLQVLSNASPFNTPFTVSVSHRATAASGVTAQARALTMRGLIDRGAKAEDFVSPGHVFPLIAHPSGVIGRQGQTEGSHDIARMAGFMPSGVICEILNEDGTVARAPDLARFAALHDLKITSVAEVLRYRVMHEVLIREVARSRLSTEFGAFDTIVFEDEVDGKEHLALVSGDPRNLAKAGVPVRIHSECLTGDVLSSRRCDCGKQLAGAMERIAADGGILLYLQQEGRGIGLGNKIRAYALQDQGHDTVEANLQLGFPADMRDFAIAAKMLQQLGVTRVRLLTNNPQKLETLTNYGIEVLERIPLITAADDESKRYISAKREKLGHLF